MRPYCATCFTAMIHCWYASHSWWQQQYGGSSRQLIWYRRSWLCLQIPPTIVSLGLCHLTFGLGFVYSYGWRCRRSLAWRVSCILFCARVYGFSLMYVSGRKTHNAQKNRVGRIGAIANFGFGNSKNDISKKLLDSNVSGVNCQTLFTRCTGLSSQFSAIFL